RRRWVELGHEGVTIVGGIVGALVGTRSDGEPNTRAGSHPGAAPISTVRKLAWAAAVACEGTTGAAHRVRLSRDIGVAGGIDRDAGAYLGVAATEVGRIEQRRRSRRRGVELGHEGVSADIIVAG